MERHAFGSQNLLVTMPRIEDMTEYNARRYIEGTKGRSIGEGFRCSARILKPPPQTLCAKAPNWIGLRNIWVIYVWMHEKAQLENITKKTMYILSDEKEEVVKFYLRYC
jgi:hypothetical protein